MISSRPNCVLLAFALGALLCTGRASAQGEPCHTFDKFKFENTQGRTPLDLSNAPYEVWLGNSKVTNQLVLFRRNLNTGNCATFGIFENGNWLKRLPRTGSICFGDFSDRFDVVTTPVTIPNCGLLLPLVPLDYGGRQLKAFMGDGNDHVHVGNGRDRVHGGSGADDIFDPGGNNDEAYGENSADDLYCSAGLATVCDGGSGADYLEEASATGDDQLIGGSNTDEIFACRPGLISCGSNIDVVYTAPNTFVTEDCETVNIACF